ncbi:DinB family protein [Kordia sp.]
MNHSTYHRGQIVTMGHQLGFTKAPFTDLFFF